MRFRLGNCRAALGYEAIAALTAVLVLDRGNRIVLCILAALLHELGHLLMMLCCGVRVRGISLRLFDVRIESDSPRSFADDIRITAAGPAANLLLAALFLPTGAFFGWANLALGCFNLLPVVSLDGGRLLCHVLRRRWDARICDRVLMTASFLFLLPLMTAGIYTLLQSGYNYSLLIVSLYLTAVLFLKQ